MKDERTCMSCRFMHQYGMDGERPMLACRRYPPMHQFIIVPRPSQKTLMVQQQPTMVPNEEQRSGFPQVLKDWNCGEWAPAVSLTS